ncbi:MAG TPA: MATE family efflux transporter [Bryobacteraceae bacterium]|jgi:putative MATE family efflux protein|nr:MATE family efflux transporter [Bryobacteraceae bacterium]
MSTSNTAEARVPGLWSSLREAVMGSSQDFTQGSISRAIVLLAVPMVLEMIMESLFGVVDVFWVAHLGADAITTVGLTETCLTVVFVIALGLSMGATAMVARRIGEKDEAAAGLVAVQAIVVGLVVSAITAAIGYFYAADLLRLMGATENVVRLGTGYTRMIFGGSVTIFLLFLINAVFRGAGDAAVAMRVLWLANIVNICLNPCLIFGVGPFPRLGVTGSAVGTTIGRGIGVAFQLWILTSGRGRFVIRAPQVRLDFAVMARMVRLSLTAIFQYMVQMASWIGVVRIIASFGSAAAAANTLAIKIIIFAILPSWGMSNAAATLVGQNLGAGKPERAELSVWRTGFYNMLFLGTVGLIFATFAEKIIGIFTNDPAVVPIAVSGLRLLSYGNISYAYGMVVTAAFNGAGDTFTPTILNLICFWVVQIPVAWLLAFHTSLGPRGAFIAVLISDTLLALLGIIWFRRGAWKRTVV